MLVVSPISEGPKFRSDHLSNASFVEAEDCEFLSDRVVF